MLSALLVAAPALKAPSAKDVGLEGEWVLVDQVIRGKPDKITRRFVLVFQADGVCLSGNGTDEATYHFHFVIDGTARPMEIDMKSHPKAGDKWAPGIFRVEGDTLTVCQATSVDEKRPTKFEPSADPPNWLYVYKRVKKKD